MSLLVLNAGSSSLKFGLFDRGTLEEQCSGRVEEIGRLTPGDFVVQIPNGPVSRSEVRCDDHRSALSLILSALDAPKNQIKGDQIEGIGHRVVHGGPELTLPVLIDSNVKAELDQISGLAPLHNPPAVSVIQAAEVELPGVKQAAVFDTAFFSNLPPEEQIYPLPYGWYTDHGIRRYGFHGISHAYCSMRTAEILDRPLTDLKLIICHLGNGCSASAVRSGSPVATTMGFTPLEGLMMGTRSGSVDPGILLHAQQELGLKVDELERILLKKSGLLGVSGVSSDFRLVEQAADDGNERARLALAMYANRIKSVIGSYAALLCGVDALVFTAGVGENAARLRALICQGLDFLGVSLDEELNLTSRTDADIARAASPARILILRTREDWLIAQQTRQLLFNQ